MPQKNYTMRIEYVQGNYQHAGLGTYEHQLAEALKKHPDIELFKTTTKNISGFPIFLTKNISADITHFTNQELLSPFVCKNKKFMATVHDLTVIKMNLFSKSPSKLRYFADKLYKLKLASLKKAKGIIVVSENTKKDFLEYLSFPEDKIKVTYEAANPSFRPIPNIKKQKHTLLFVGNELPHKNMPTLLSAIALVKKNIPDIKLMKIGSGGWRGTRAKLMKLIKKLNIKDAVFFKQNVPNITDYYNSAEALILPSLYEGFGLPVLEAMACGCPVICSNTTALPEIAGDAALYVDPKQSYDIAEKIIALLTNKQLKQKLIRKGLERNKKFTWEKCAAQTAAAYQQFAHQ